MKFDSSRLEQSPSEPEHPDNRANVKISLRAWGEAMDDALERRDTERVFSMSRIVLKQAPRHLPTYFRLLQALWIARLWEEGKDWAQRLLHADPGNELAWAMLARAAEEHNQLEQARLYWSRAFENAPYNRIIRAGKNRTFVGRPNCLALTPACLGTLYRFGGRWEKAVRIYRPLVAKNPERLDLQCGLLEALWQAGANYAFEALQLARHLANIHPELLLAWIVGAEIGDETDRALAQAPLMEFDDGFDYASWRYNVPSRPNSRTILVSPADARLLPQQPATSE
jgi:tetratricopeptide (TPR) repeat protein